MHKLFNPVTASHMIAREFHRDCLAISSGRNHAEPLPEMPLGDQSQTEGNAGHRILWGARLKRASDGPLTTTKPADDSQRRLCLCSL